MENLNFDTLVEAINGMKSRGYTEDFNLESKNLVCGATSLGKDDFTVDYLFRFEGDSNPDDEAILYAISDKNSNVKGVLTTSYGAYTNYDDPETLELIKNLKLA